MCTASIAEDLEIPSTIAKAIMNILHALNNQFQAEAASNVLESILLNFWNIEPFFLTMTPRLNICGPEFHLFCDFSSIWWH